MAWWVVPAIQAAGMIGSAVISSNARRRQGSAAARTAMWNSQQDYLAGQRTASMIEGFARGNAAMTIAAGDLTSAQQLAIAKYNASLRSMIGDYNARLLENEEILLWEALDLDITQMEKQYAREAGRMRAAYGASGVRLDQDTPLQAMIDSRTEHEFEKLVVRHEADLQSKKLLDAAARSRWEGNLEAQQIIFEGKWASISNALNSRLQAAGILGQGYYDSAMTRFNAGVRSRGRLQEGLNARTSYDNQATSDIVSGLYGAGMSFASSYLKNKFPSTGGGGPSGNYAINYTPGYQTQSRYTQSLLA